MFTFQNIYNAYKKCRRNKTNTMNVLKFEQDLLSNLWNLVEELQGRRYRVGRSICFLTHSPKLREVFAADFRDRIVHHLLIDAIEPLYEKKFIHDVYNNRAGKGIHRAKERAERYMRGEPEGYYLQLDIKGFFYHLDKDILYATLCDDLQYAKLPHKEEILWLARTIIYHDPTGNYHFQGDKRALESLPSHKSLFGIASNKGLPIGNLTSQFFANVTMNRFDHFIKRELKAKAYLRYVDDFVIFEQTPEILVRYHESIAYYLVTRLGLSLREDHRLRPNRDGLDFLGYIIRPHYTLVRRRVVNNYKQKKAKYLDEYENQKGKMSLAEIKQFLSVRASFVSHAKHANSYNLLNKIGAINETNPFDFDRAECRGRSG